MVGHRALSLKVMASGRPRNYDQCVRLWVTFRSLQSMAFNFAKGEDGLILLLMASTLLIFFPFPSCWEMHFFPSLEQSFPFLWLSQPFCMVSWELSSFPVWQKFQHFLSFWLAHWHLFLCSVAFVGNNSFKDRLDLKGPPSP